MKKNLYLSYFCINYVNAPAPTPDADNHVFARLYLTFHPSFPWLVIFFGFVKQLQTFAKAPYRIALEFILVPNPRALRCCGKIRKKLACLHIFTETIEGWRLSLVDMCLFN